MNQQKWPVSRKIRYFLALLILTAFSLVMFCNTIVTLTLCNPYTVVEAASPIVEASDENVVWEIDTPVEIFSLRYDETGQVTVLSANGDKVFAPGTAQTYDFRVTNKYTKNVTYTLTAEGYFSDNLEDERKIPIVVRFYDYDSKYFVGSDTGWERPEALNEVNDTRTLLPNSYIRYSLDWQWPFESGDDAYDTFLGDLAVDEDLTLTIRLMIVAEADEESEGEGEDVPVTGDDFKAYLWGALLFISVTAVVIMVVCLVIDRKSRKKGKKNDEGTEKKESPD